MTMVIVMADVEDGVTWERKYRSHSDLLKAGGVRTVHYSVGGDGHVVICAEVDDVGAYMEFVNSKSTQDAMKNNGVKRETVEVVVLEKQFSV
jgi:hypothetical protein